VFEKLQADYQRFLELDAALLAAQLDARVVVTSANAARAATEAAARLGLGTGAFRWAAVGEATAAVLAHAGIEGAFVPSRPDGATLAAELPLGPSEELILPRTDIADESLPAALRARGARVRSVVAYRTVEAPESSRVRLAAAIDDGTIDAVILTSGSTARGLLALAADEATLEGLRSTPVLAIGEPTARASRELGFTTVLVAPSPEPAALAAFVAASLGVRQPASMAAGGAR